MLLTFPCVLFFFLPLFALAFLYSSIPSIPHQSQQIPEPVFWRSLLVKRKLFLPTCYQACALIHWVGGGSSNILGSWVFTLPCRALWGSFRWELALYIKVNCQTCSCLWKREQNLKIANNLELPVKTTKYVISSLIFSHKWVYILL